MLSTAFGVCCSLRAALPRVGLVVTRDEDDTETRESPGERNADVRNKPYLLVLQGRSVGEYFLLRPPKAVIGRSDDAEVQILDDGVSRKHAEVHFKEDGTYFLRDLGSKNGTFVNGKPCTEDPLQEGDKIQLGAVTVLKFTLQDRMDESYQKRMYDSALRDGLTRLYNKRYLLTRLDTEFAFARRQSQPLSLLMIDLDHFKKLNDTWGHVVGDQVLVAIARTIEQNTRHEDVIARYGGEEFCVISRAIALDGALILAERIRSAIARQPLHSDGKVVRVTSSVGVAEVDAIMTGPLDLIGRADEALYRAKGAGRNRIEPPAKK